MKPHQERVVVEKKELDEKRDKLTEFLKGDVYRTLSQDEQMRLARQLETMDCYSGILAERIAHFVLVLLLCVALSGCAHAYSTTRKFDPDTGNVTELTKMRVTTFFDSQSQLSKFRNTTGQVGNGSNVWSYPSGTSIGSLNQEASGTNAVSLFEAGVRGAVEGAVKAGTGR